MGSASSSSSKSKKQTKRSVVVSTDKKSDITLAVFGMSTEGYDIARQAAIDGATVYLIDESNPTAISLNPEIARTYQSISALEEDEPIMSLEPIHVAVSKADYLFFTPRIRSDAHNTKANMQALFKDAIEYISEKTSIVFCAPVGIGENNEYISILEHVTGLEIDVQAYYYYYPLESKRPLPQVIGASDISVVDNDLGLLLSPDSEHTVAKFVTLQTSEYKHAFEIVSRFANVCSAIELGQFIPNDIVSEFIEDSRIQDLYLDSMVAGLADMRVLEVSLESAKSLQRMTSIYTKTVQSYIRRLVDEVKRIMRDHGMKTAKIKVMVLWTFDSNLLRGDRSKMCDFFIERLQEWVVDVDAYSELPREMFITDIPLVIISCTAKDFKAAISAKKDRPNLLVIKANPLCQVFGNA